MSPLLGADGIAVQRIYDGIASRFLLRVARRQEHEYVAIHGVSLQITFQGIPVDLYVLHRNRLRTRNDGRHVGLNLRCDPKS